MNNLTELDRAHAKMQADETDSVARLSFFERLSDTEFFLLLADEPDENTVKPHVFTLDEQQYVLVFDREERLASFVGKISPYAALSGRAIVNMLAGQKIGLGVNLDVASSSILIPVNAVEWLFETLAQSTIIGHDQSTELSSPNDVSEVLLKALDTKLALATGLATAAYLVRAKYRDGRSDLLLGFIDAELASERALSQAIAEALVFSGLETGAIDVAFFKSDGSVYNTLKRVGLRFDIPEIETVSHASTPPGMDPDKPPRLR